MYDHGIVRVGPGCERPSAAAGAATENHTHQRSDQLQEAEANLNTRKLHWHRFHRYLPQVDKLCGDH